MSEDENTDTLAYYLDASGKVEMKEKDAETELLNDSMVKRLNMGILFQVMAHIKYI